MPEQHERFAPATWLMASAIAWMAACGATPTNSGSRPIGRGSSSNPPIASVTPAAPLAQVDTPAPPPLASSEPSPEARWDAEWLRIESQIPHHWTIALHRTRKPRESPKDWTRRLLRLIEVIGGNQPFCIWGMGEPTLCKPDQDVDPALAKKMRGPSSFAQLVLGPPTTHKGSAIFITLEVGPVIAKPLPGAKLTNEDRRQRSEPVRVEIEFASIDAPGIRRRLQDALVAASKVVESEWGHVYANSNKLTWKRSLRASSEDDGEKMTDEMIYGVPRIGWLTLLKHGEFTRVPSKLDDARISDVDGVGQLITFVGAPWVQGNRSGMQKFIAFQKRVLATNVIRPSSTAAAALAPVWSKQGLNVGNVRPKVDPTLVPSWTVPHFD